MRILDRYINNSILKVFISTILIICFLYILIEITCTLDEIISRKIPIDILIKYYISFLPIIIKDISPIACLISILFPFTNLNTNNEIIAMRSSGLNFWKITKPALCFGIFISVLVLLLNERFVPQATQITQQIREENFILYVDRLRKKKENIKNLTFYGLKNRLYFIDSFNPHTSELNGITIIEYDKNQNIVQKIVAFKGIWTGIAWKFYQCQITNYGKTGINSPIKIKVYTEKLMDIKETPKDLLKQRLNISSMNIKQLSGYITRFSNSGAKKALNNLKVDLHQKFAYPFGNFIIVLVGLPFALMIRSRKGTTFISLGVALIIGFLYYVTNAVFLALGKGALIPPFFAAWSASILFGIIALILIEVNY